MPIHLNRQPYVCLPRKRSLCTCLGDRLFMIFKCPFCHDCQSILLCNNGRKIAIRLKFHLEQWHPNAHYTFCHALELRTELYRSCQQFQIAKCEYSLKVCFNEDSAMHFQTKNIPSSISFERLCSSQRLNSTNLIGI